MTMRWSQLNEIGAPIDHTVAAAGFPMPAAVPPRDAQATSGGADRDDAATPPGPRILVVDDVFDNRDILTRRLRRRGFAVKEASSGREALDMLDQNIFDLVLLDIMMPDICGNEVLRSIRQSRSAFELPVIMVSAKSHSEDVVTSLELGANDYVTKPIDFAVALARINGQLARKQSADAALRARQDAERRADEAAESVERQRGAEQRIHYLAYHDGLTGLLNRTAFREVLGMAIHEAAQAGLDPALLFVDLDRFKAINDVYGHEMGDRLLHEVAERLRAEAGEGSALARLGGDEFAVLLKAPRSAEHAAETARRIVAALCDPFIIDGQQFQIGASCGLATVSDCEGQLDILLKAADLAMYSAKSGGRGQFVRFQPAMLDEMKARSALEVDLRRAIHDEELDLVYQPLINTATMQVAAFEALVRWDHPGHGLLEPGSFIEIAEETGLIMPLGALVLRRACAEAATWPGDIRVAVNLSPRQFRSTDLLSTIEAALASSGLRPDRLEIEITELALIEAGEASLDILTRIRALGVRVSVDDFGTGPTFMTYLRSFAFDKIKIDRRFVRGLRPGQNGPAIIRAITERDGNGQIAVAAEGIETREELDALTSYGCTELQGFLFSRPLTAADARAVIGRRLAANLRETGTG